MSKMNLEEFARLFDHTNLKAEATVDDIKKLCHEAIKFRFGAVCINPSYVSYAWELLHQKDVDICTVIGFPLGSTPSEVKAFEAKQAMEDGATELDMVINVGALRSGNLELLRSDILAVREATKGKILKVILETCYLTKEEIVKACEIAKKIKADFVKTSTGFGSEGATIENVKLMRKTVGPKMGVKASGGIKTYKKAMQILEAGANRIGASSSVQIVEEFKKNL